MRRQPGALFRVDSGLAIGGGHLVRCLTLADALAGEGVSCAFACRDHAGTMSALVEARGHALHRLPVDPDAVSQPGYAGWRGASVEFEIADLRGLMRSRATDLLVIDHYGIDAAVEAPLADACDAVVVIDDLHDRRHAARVLIDHNIGRRASDYDGLVPPDAQLLIGPVYGLLNPAYAAARAAALERRAGQAPARRLLIAIGGGDRPDVTGTVLSGLSGPHRPDWIEAIDVVLTSNAPHLARVAAFCDTTPGAALHVDVPDLATLMASADAAIGAPGVTAMERCVLGLPSLVVILAENQRSAALSLGKANAVLNLGDADEATWPVIAAALRSFADRACRDSMTAAAAVLCDGAGLARVIEHLQACSTSP